MKRSKLILTLIIFTVALLPLTSATITGSDDFNRANNAVVGGTWTETASTAWNINTNKLAADTTRGVMTGTIVADNNYHCIYFAENPANALSLEVQVDTTGNTANVQIVDNGNPYYIRYHTGSAWTPSISTGYSQIGGTTLCVYMSGNQPGSVWVGIDDSNYNLIFNYTTSYNPGPASKVQLDNNNVALTLDNYCVATVITDCLPDSPPIAFQGQTPANNTINYQPITSNFTINTTTKSIAGTINQSHYLYNSTGSLIIQNNQSSGQNYTTTYSALNVGTYYYNATVTNGTYTNYTETRTIHFYNLTTGTITTPTTGQHITTRLLNTTWTNATITPTGTGITVLNFTLTLHNSDTSFNQTIGTTTNLNYSNINMYNKNLQTGIYWLNITTRDTQNNAVSSTLRLIYLDRNGILNLTLYNMITAQQEQIFNATIHDTTTGETYTTSTTNGKISVDSISGTSWIYIYNDNNTITRTNYTGKTINTNYTAYNLTIYPIARQINFSATTNATVQDFESTIYKYTNINNIIVNASQFQGDYIYISYGTGETQQYILRKSIIEDYVSELAVLRTLTDYQPMQVMSRGQPISDAIVRVYEGASAGTTYSHVYSGLTDADGNVVLYFVGGTAYQLVTQAQGYQTKTEGKVLTGDASTYGIITLLPTSDSSSFSPITTTCPSSSTTGYGYCNVTYPETIDGNTLEWYVNNENGSGITELKTSTTTVTGENTTQQMWILNCTEPTIYWITEAGGIEYNRTLRTTCTYYETYSTPITNYTTIQPTIDEAGESNKNLIILTAVLGLATLIIIGMGEKYMNGLGFVLGDAFMWIIGTNYISYFIAPAVILLIAMVIWKGVDLIQ